MAINIYNTLNRKKEELKTNTSGEISMYVCGPTTYNFIHLGNARPIVIFDTIRRYLKYKGFKVNFVQNFTDIDDKIIKKAQEENENPLELAEKYIGEYFKDVKALNVQNANVHPKVSEHIKEIIDLVKAIIDKGHAYVVNGDVYFDVRSYASYGKLSGRSLDDLQSGARVEIDKKKKNPLDFALWKAAKPGEPYWESPWGKGRPGWHIECSAMSMKYLGETFDIHGGGHDLIFPHHENEIAQAEAATGKIFANYWIHNGFITVNKEKMSKSLGNFFLVRDILQKFSGDVVRYYLLATHYRSPLDFDDTKLAENEKALMRIKNTIFNIKGILDNIEDRELDQVEEEILNKLFNSKKDFETAMNDDFNTSLAISIIFELCREINSYINKLGSESGCKELLEKSWNIIRELTDEVLGIVNYDDLFGQNEDENNRLVDDLMDMILKIRQGARTKKDWITADLIRDELNELNIVIEDTPQGPRWKR